MSNISTLFYSIKQGLKNIYRNRMFSLASVGTMTACIFMFGIFYFILSNFQYMIQNAETNVGITIFFEEGTDASRIEKIGQEIEGRPEVERITYTSAEEAWDKFSGDLFSDNGELEESFGEDNPLKDSQSYEINLKDVSKQGEFVKYLEKIPEIRKINSSDTTAKTLSSFNILVGYVSGAIIIILVAVAVFLISTTVTMGIAVRKDEIAIMRLVGATDFFIRAPFIVEGLAIGLIGTILPLVILYAVYNKVIAYVAVKFSVLSGLLTFLDVNYVFGTLVPAAFLIGIGIGFLGSFVTVHKHLKV